jgi:hypothetical protein
MQTNATALTPTPAGGILIGLAGAAMIASRFVNWGEPTVIIGKTRLPIPAKAGMFVLLVGIVLVALGTIVAVSRLRGVASTIAVVAVIGGLGMAWLSGQYVLSEKAYRDFWVANCSAAVQDCPQSDLAGRLERGIANGSISFDPERGLGVYLAFAGGLLAMTGGVVTLRRKPRPPAPPTADPSSGDPQSTEPHAPDDLERSEPQGPGDPDSPIERESASPVEPTGESIASDES